MTWRSLSIWPSRLAGVYNPITHQWTVPPPDEEDMDREQRPIGQRTKGQFWA